MLARTDLSPHEYNYFKEYFDHIPTTNPRTLEDTFRAYKFIMRRGNFRYHLNKWD